MSRQLYPLVYELIDAINDRNSPRAYFRDFETSIEESPKKAGVWAAREGQFQSLDTPSWEQLKAEAIPYLSAKDENGRGWTQLISILNQARAHNYLKRRGCSGIRFIPRAKQAGIETPVLEAKLGGREVLCEVKTLEISDDEVKARKEILGRNTQQDLPAPFLNKLTKTLAKAQSQLHSYRANTNSECIAFLVVNFDDWPGEYKESYYRDIDDHLQGRASEDCQVVIYNETTIFHSVISMVNAEVVNEDG